MAAALDPDEVLSSRWEKDNFHRLTRLLISGGTQLLKEIFDSRCPPTVLPGILSNPATKNQLKKAKLTKPQWDCLYPSPGTCGKSEDFDVTLLFRLLRTICSLAPPTTGWDALPASTDHTLEADLARIKYYRNSVYGHVNQNMDIKDDDFLRLWQEISQALVRTAGKISSEKETEWQLAIDNFLKDSLTAEDERNVQELHKWYKEDMNVKESIEQLAESLNKSMEEVKECMNEFRVCRRISCPNCNEVDVALLPLTVSCVAITQPEQRGEPQGMAISGNCPPPTAQEVLNLASQKYLQTINPSKPEELNGFLQYLRDVRQLLFVDAKEGSLIITVGCRSLQILEDLWIDFCTGRLNKMAEKYLVTKELLNELGLKEAKLTTSISEKEYRSCRNQLSVYRDLEQRIEQLKKRRDQLQNQFFHWARIGIRIRALETEFVTNPRGSSLGRSVGMAALVGGGISVPFTFGMSMVYSKNVAIRAVAAVATGAAGAAVYGGVFAAVVGPRGTFIGLIGAAVAPAAAFGWKAALVGAAIAMPYTLGMSVPYGNAIATGAVAAVAAVAAGAAGAAGAVAAAAAGAVGAVATGAIAVGAAVGGAEAVAGAVDPEAVAGGAVLAVGVAGALALAAGTEAAEAIASGALAAGAVIVGAAGFHAVVGAGALDEDDPRVATAAAVAGDLARGAVGALAVAGAAALATGAAGVRTEFHLHFVQDKKALQELKSKVHLFKQCVGDLAAYCREKTDQVQSSRLMVREFPFLRDILLRKREQEVRTLSLTLPAPLEKELNIPFTRLLNLLEDLIQCEPGNEDSRRISRQILDELHEDPNDEQIRAMIVDFIKREFARS